VITTVLVNQTGKARIVMSKIWPVLEALIRLMDVLKLSTFMKKNKNVLNINARPKPVTTDAIKNVTLILVAMMVEIAVWESIHGNFATQPHADLIAGMSSKMEYVTKLATPKIVCMMAEIVMEPNLNVMPITTCTVLTTMEMDVATPRVITRLADGMVSIVNLKMSIIKSSKENFMWS
jgi:hypothetical protein